MIRRAPNFLRHLWRDENGNGVLEFVIVFPAIMYVFLSGIEAGVMMLRTAMLERGLDIAIREVRIGKTVQQATDDDKNPLFDSVTGEPIYEVLDRPPSFEEFRQLVCDTAIVVPDCMKSLQVEMQVVNTTTWQPLDQSARCVDKDSNLNPFADSNNYFNTGINNDFMLVRLCANVDPILPGIGLGALLDNDGANGFAIVALSGFVNEPSRTQ